jgi:hypothetical protein
MSWLSRAAWQPTFRASPRQNSVRRQVEDVRPGIGEFDFKAGGKVPRMIRLGPWVAGGSDEDDPGRRFESAGVEVKVKVDAVLEKSTPSVSRRKDSKSVVSQKRSSSVEDDRTGREMVFVKPCGIDATSSVEEDNATVPSVGCFGVLGSDMLSHSRSTSASSSSHAL